MGDRKIEQYNNIPSWNNLTNPTLRNLHSRGNLGTFGLKKFALSNVNYSFNFHPYFDSFFG